MIPAVLVAEERDPLAVGRGPRLRAGFAPIRNAPEFFFVDFVTGFYGAGGGVGDIDGIFLEVFGLAVKDQTVGVNPRQAAVLAGRADGHGFSAVQLQRVDLAGNVFRDAIDEFRAGVRRGFVVLDDFGAGDISERISVGGPNDAANTYVVMRDRGFRAVGKPANDKVASFARALVIGAVAADERNALGVRRRSKSAAAVLRAPSRLGFASACRNFPKISFVNEVNAFAVVAPEGIGNRAFGKSGQRDGRAAAVRVRRVEIFDVRAVPGEHHMLVVRRPNGIRRMLNFNQLFDGESRLAAGRLRLRVARAYHRRDRYC